MLITISNDNLIDSQNLFPWRSITPTLISSIPTIMREGFNVQNLPLRASTVSEELLVNVFGSEVARCFPQKTCRISKDCWSLLCACVKSSPSSLRRYGYSF